MRKKFSLKIFFMFVLAAVVFVASYVVVSGNGASFIATMAKSIGQRNFTAAISESVKSGAQKYLNAPEKFGDPVTLIHNGAVYYYFPLEKNGTILGTLPGIFVDTSGKVVTSRQTLIELFRYPGTLLRFADNVKEFRKVAKKKAGAVEDYCKIIQKQQAKLGGIVASGRAVGVVYEGTKLAFDAVGMVKTGVTGFKALVKDLAKSKIQDSILSYFSSTDTRAVLDSAQRALDISVYAVRACDSVQGAWESIKDKNEKVTTAQMKSATEDLFVMFKNEAESIKYLQQSLERVNLYPELVTKISEKDYRLGMLALTNLVNRLSTEKNYWKNEYDNTTTFLEDWAEEHGRRINSLGNLSPVAEATKTPTPTLTRAPTSTPTKTPIPATPTTGPACSNPDLSSSYSVYNYSKEVSPCPTYQKGVSSGRLSLRCSSATAQWRTYWVKKIAVPSGATTTSIKATLGLKDYRGFFSECSYGGVKSPDYVDLIVLSYDPSSSLGAECNRLASEANWSKCAVLNSGSGVLGHCGVPACSESKSCNFQVSTTGLSYIYVVFRAADAWMADVEGALSGLEVCKAN